jgi:two-component system NtrC family response regulator
MLDLVEKVKRVAGTEASLLLQGESGTGKEVIAEMVHRLSRRRDKPLVKVNCAALPESLLESELFGHARGAFTGASQERQGLFEAADGATLLLDEVGELPLAMQSKFLRVLQSGEFHRLGDARCPIRVDVRLIAASNRDLADAVERGEFRQDLYYRLNVVPLTVPPLRERMQDLPTFADHFLRVLRQKSLRVDRRPVSISAAALAAMQRHSWPGNVRELENAIECAMVMCSGLEIRLEHLPESVRTGLASDAKRDVQHPDEPVCLQDAELRCIREALRRTGGNNTHAARILGIKRSALCYRIAKHHLEDELATIRRDARPGAEAS